MRWRTVLLTLILATLCFGGSFTCEGHKNSTTVTTP